MSHRTIRNLAIVLFALVAILIGLEFSNNGTSPSTSGDRLFSDLREQINELDRLVIDGPEAEQTVVARNESGWIVETSDGYPADVGKVREVLLALADAGVLEEKTSNPERYEALGVRDPEADDSRGLRLTASGGDAEFSVILGDTNQGSNRYARIAGQATSVLIDSNPALPEQPGGWLESDLLDVEADDVRDVTIRHADGETLRIEKTSREDADFTVADIPEGRELSYPSVANSIAQAFNDLNLTDVRSADEVAGIESQAVTELTTFDGLQIEVSVFGDETDEERWIGVTAAVAAPMDESAESEPEDEGDVDPEASGEAGSDDDVAAAAEPSAEAQAASINERAAGRQFRVADYQLDQLTRRWDDILQAESDESEEDGE